ncbi:MAG: hypothetical protein LBK97_06115 [Prevotellaceae bacterium]|nr:hypothetical protein [Prevotellaceae bacterium]
MKRTKVQSLYSIALIIGLILSGTVEVSAQKWLEKALKKVDNALNEVDKVLTETDKVLGNPVEQAGATPGYESVTVKSFSADVDFVIESCIFDGKLLILNFSLNNRGKDLQMGSFGGRKTLLMPNVETKFYDDLGNAWQPAYVTAGAAWRFGTDGADFGLPEGVKVNGSIGITKFDRKATVLQSATIAGYIRDDTKSESNGKYTPFSISLKNVPVYKAKQLLGRDKALFTKEKPAVEGGKPSDCTVKSVVITERNTQVNFTYTGSYVGNIYVDDFASIHILAGGKRYPLTAAFGIATNKHQREFYAGGSQQDFTLVFEPLPKPSETIDILFDDWIWKNVRLLDPVGLNIPETRGILSLDDSYDRHDNRRRITAMERNDLKINAIKNDNFDTKWTNSQLSAGKTIYKGKEGSLQTILFIEKEQAVNEFLVSYNPEGNPVDCISIASISAYGGDRGEGLVQGNTVTAYAGYEGIVTYNVYHITPELKFEFISKEDPEED